MMPRTPKAKPKIETVREESDELARMANTLINKLCPNLKSAVIVYVMKTRQNDDGKAVAPKVGEKMGSARAAGVWDRMLYHWDFRIEISGNHWEKLDVEQRKALLYHELCHCFMDNSRPRMQKHEFEGFLSELKHFGAWAGDLQAVQEVLQPQLELVGEDFGEDDAEVAVDETDAARGSNKPVPVEPQGRRRANGYDAPKFAQQ